MRTKWIVILGLTVLLISCKVYREISDETLESIVKTRSTALRKLKQEFLSSPEIRAVYGRSLSKVQLTGGPAGREANETALPDHIKASLSRIRTLMRSISAQSAWKSDDDIVLAMASYGVDGWECTKCLELAMESEKGRYPLLPSVNVDEIRPLLMQLELQSQHGLQSNRRSAVFYKKLDDQAFVLVSCLR